MPRRTTPLSDTQLRAIKSQSKRIKLFDGGGLFLLVTPTGGKLWRLKYRFGGTERLLSFGAYPQISLVDARQKRDQVRAQIAQGVDPGETKRAETKKAETFEALADEWLARQENAWTPKHGETIKLRLASYVFPHLGARPVSEITAPELLGVLRKIEARGTFETARRVKQICSQVFRYGVGEGVCPYDPSAGLRGQLAAKPKVKHMAAITDRKEVAGLLRAIDGYTGFIITRCALRLAPLVFVRPGELQGMEWAEIDLDAALWTIPAAKMKMRKIHAVPLSGQSLAILDEIRPFTGGGKYVFPSARTTARHISNMAINAALRLMGYTKEVMTGHGFRSTASSLLHESGWDSNLIELQLAHRGTNTVRAVYNRAERLDDRRKMMQAWADYLDALKTGAKIIPLRSVEG